MPDLNHVDVHSNFVQNYQLIFAEAHSRMHLRYLLITIAIHTKNLDVTANLLPMKPN